MPQPRSTVRMPALALAAGLALLTAALAPRSQAEEAPEPAPAVKSEIRKTAAGERILIHRLTVRAPVAAVWKAYTTEVGYTAWAAPKARIDLRVGGEILTRYDAGELGAAGTNRLRILGYVPEELLTLKAVASDAWPELLREDAENLSNVVVFRRLGDAETEIVSYGIGYRDIEAYDRLLGFFQSANTKLFEGLRRYLEDGTRAYPAR